MAAGAAVADAPGRGRGQAEVVEGAVQLATDLMEQLLARDQLVCGQLRRQSLARTLTRMHAPSLLYGARQ